MKRFAKILMASLLAFALTAASVPALVAYARDEAIEGAGRVGWDDTIPSSSSQVSTSSTRPTTTSSSRPTTTSGAVTTTSRSTTTSVGTTTSRRPATSSSRPEIPQTSSDGGGGDNGGGGTTSVSTTSYTPVRVTTTSQTTGLAAGGGAGGAGGGTSTPPASSRSTSISSTSLASSLPEEDIEEVEIPVDDPPPNPTANIFGYDVALGGPRQIGGWSLFSLLMVVLGVLAGLAFAIRNKTSGKGDKAMYLVSAFAALPVLLFFILQDFTQMYVFNHLSALFAILFVVHLIVLLAVNFRGKKPVDEEIEEA